MQTVESQGPSGLRLYLLRWTVLCLSGLACFAVIPPVANAQDAPAPPQDLLRFELAKTNEKLAQAHLEFIAAAEQSLNESVSDGKLELSVATRELIEAFTTAGPYKLGTPDSIMRRTANTEKAVKANLARRAILDRVIGQDGTQAIQVVDGYRSALSTIHDDLLARLKEGEVAETKAGRLDSALKFHELAAVVTGQGAFDPFPATDPATSGVDEGQADPAQADDRALPAGLNSCFAEFSVVGHVEIGGVNRNARRYLDRDLRWGEVPEWFRGMKFTRHGIGIQQTYTINVSKAGDVVVTFSDFGGLQNSGVFFEQGWRLVDRFQHDPGVSTSTFLVAAKYFEPGQYVLPVGHPDSGTIVLFPPEK